MRNRCLCGVAGGVILGLTSILSVGHAVAQPGQPEAARGKTPPVQPEGEVRRADKAEKVTRVSVKFKGGTVEQFFGELQRSAEPYPINVMLPADAREMPMPGIELRNVLVQTAVEAAQAASKTDHGQIKLYVIRVDEESATFGSEIISYRSPMPQNPNMQIGPGRTGFVSPGGQDVGVFSVNDLVNPVQAGAPKVEQRDLLAAVENVLRSAAFTGEPEPRVVMHVETGTLVVSATPGQIDAVRTLLMQLKDDQERRQRFGGRSVSERDQLERQIRIQESRLKALAVRLEGLKMREGRAAEMVKQGQGTPDELSQVRTQVAEVESNILEQSMKMDEYRAMLDSMPPEQAEKKETVIIDLRELSSLSGAIQETITRVCGRDQVSFVAAEGAGAKGQITLSTSARNVEVAKALAELAKQSYAAGQKAKNQ